MFKTLWAVLIAGTDVYAIVFRFGEEFPLRISVLLHKCPVVKERLGGGDISLEPGDRGALTLAFGSSMGTHELIFSKNFQTASRESRKLATFPGRCCT